MRPAKHNEKYVIQVKYIEACSKYPILYSGRTHKIFIEIIWVYFPDYTDTHFLGPSWQLSVICRANHFALIKEKPLLRPMITELNDTHTLHWTPVH